MWALCGHSSSLDIDDVWVIYGTIEVKNIHQKATHPNKTKFCVDNIVIVIGSIVNTIWRDYVMSIEQ